jgi:hypothetical protein
VAAFHAVAFLEATFPAEAFLVVAFPVEAFLAVAFPVEAFPVEAFHAAASPVVTSLVGAFPEEASHAVVVGIRGMERLVAVGIDTLVVDIVRAVVGIELVVADKLRRNSEDMIPDQAAVRTPVVDIVVVDHILVEAHTRVAAVREDIYHLGDDRKSRLWDDAICQDRDFPFLVLFS